MNNNFELSSSKANFTSQPLVTIDRSNRSPTSKIDPYDLCPSLLEILKDIFKEPRAKSLCNKKFCLTNHVMDDGKGDWVQLISIGRIS